MQGEEVPGRPTKESNELGQATDGSLSDNERLAGCLAILPEQRYQTTPLFVLEFTINPPNS